MSPAQQLSEQLRPLGTGTAILTAALLAGTQLFRNTGLDFGLEPGSYVIVELLDELGMALLGRLDESLLELAASPVGGWPELVGTGPSQTLLELVERSEPGFLKVLSKEGIAASDAPELAIRAAAVIISGARDVLDPEMGKMIVAQGLVHACKHAPPKRQV